MIDCIVEGGTVRPLYSRLLCDVAKLTEALDGLPWPDDGESVLAFDKDGQTAIAAALFAADIGYTVEAATPVDPALLAALHGKVTTRTEALACIAAGKVPLTLTELEDRVEALESKGAGT